MADQELVAKILNAVNFRYPEEIAALYRQLTGEPESDGYIAVADLGLAREQLQAIADGMIICPDRMRIEQYLSSTQD
jgi:hypothetical protein